MGSDDGSHIASVIPFRKNVYLADILQDTLIRGKERFGFRTTLLDESDVLPFPNEYFDIVFCSSLIEHVTVDKKDLARFRSQAEFSAAAEQRQQRLSSEIRLVGKRYYVQTLNKYFLIESHTWLPVLIVFLPRILQIKTIDFMNIWWPKKTSPDWNLLTQARMRELFPDGEIVLEKSLGFTKSIMAIRN